MSLAEWSINDLKEWDDKICKLAKSYGLDWYPINYEVCDYFLTNGSIELPRKTFKSWMMKFPRKFMNKLSPQYNAHLFGGSSIMILAK